MKMWKKQFTMCTWGISYCIKHVRKRSKL